MPSLPSQTAECDVLGEPDGIREPAMSRKIRLTKVRAGEWATPDGSHHIVHRWADQPGWTILAVWAPKPDSAQEGFVDVKTTHRTLREALNALDQPPVT
jgi:hypothetical protein